MQALTLALAAASLPADRVTWWDPGVRGDVPQVPTRVTVAKTDDADAIQRAIDACPTPGAVLVPAGGYRITKQLRLRAGVVLRGEGANKTKLVANFVKGGYAGAVGMYGASSGKPLPVAGRVPAGAQSVELAQPAKLAPGAFVMLNRDNDPNVMYTRKKWDVRYGHNAVGQIVQVERVEGRRVHFDSPIRLDYEARFNPRLRPLKPIERAGIESLTITREDNGENFQIYINCAVNCWVTDCELTWCNRAHVWANASRWLTIRGNVIHHAHNYGGGGHGYGVVMSNASSDCLIEDNTFWWLRHSTMTKVGACGNVFAYNASFKPCLSDVSIHGHFSYANLWEGNIMQWITSSDWWGPTGPFTTIFRNRASTLRIKDHSHRQNVVGNSIRGAFQIERSCRDAWVEGNWVMSGHREPGGTDTKMEGNVFGEASDGLAALPASLYLKAQPKWWPADLPWPAIGADVDIARTRAGQPLHVIPAEARYRRLVPPQER